MSLGGRRVRNGLRRTLPAAAVALLCGGPALAGDPIFDPAVLHETRVVMDPDDWQALRDNFRENQYYAANLSIDGQVVEQVGLRSRGKGSRDAIKPGLRLDFNRYGRGRNFHGMTSLVLDNEIQDTSVLREFLAYQVFEAMAIPAPQAAFTRVTVNDQYWGVYLLTEEIRKPFLAARLGQDDGNLFKYEWNGNYDFAWRGEDPKEYIPLPFEPHTHEADLDPAGLIDFIRTFNEAPDETFLQDVSSHIDPKQVLTYLAVEDALAESDGFAGDDGMNNYYLYQYAGTSRFLILPWDKDTALQRPDWPIFRKSDENVLLRRLLERPALQQVYVDAVLRTAHDFVNPRWLTPKLEAAYRLIRNAVLADAKKPYSNDDFELSVEGLRGIIAAREADVTSQLRD